MTPEVSVRILTYNHEKYIRRCLEGVLMQRTNFEYEIVIGEDCSNDATLQIVKEFKKEFPSIINVISHPVNVGIQENSRKVKEACLGKYHASCEGDDYWIDPNKLQMQYDFMEDNPGCSLHVHNALEVWDNIEKPTRKMVYFPSGRISLANLLNGYPWPLPTAGRFLRASTFEELPEWFYDDSITHLDFLTCLFCALRGEVYFDDVVTSIYNRHPESMTLSKSTKRNPQFFVESFDAFTHYKYSFSLKCFLMKRKFPYRQIRFARRLVIYLFNPKILCRKLLD